MSQFLHPRLVAFGASWFRPGGLITCDWGFGCGKHSHSLHPPKNKSSAARHQTAPHTSQSPFQSLKDTLELSRSLPLAPAPGRCDPFIHPIRLIEHSIDLKLCSLRVRNRVQAPPPGCGVSRANSRFDCGACDFAGLSIFVR